MKFSDGNWMLPAGMSILNPHHVHAVRTDARKAEILALAVRGRGRADQINAPALTVTLTAPMEGIIGVRIGQETLSADAIVVAAGAWSARLLRPLGIRVPLETQRGYHVELPPESLGISRIVAPYDAKAFITPMEQALRIAGSMLQNGLDKETVQKITGLSADELKPLYC